MNTAKVCRVNCTMGWGMGTVIQAHTAVKTANSAM